MARLRYLESEERRYVQLAESNLAAAAQTGGNPVGPGCLPAGPAGRKRSRLAQIEDQLARTRSKAPFGGIVVERLMMPR